MKKQHNQGFSMVELIIVIAIMAILAGALAPALIKYINKSRISADIETASVIAGAIVDVLSEDNKYREDAVDHPNNAQKVNSMDGNDFKTGVYAILSKGPSDKIYGKAKKDINGGALTDKEFYYKLDETKNKVQIYYGGTTADYMMYPDLGSKFSEQ